MTEFIVSQEKPMRPKHRFEVVDSIPEGFFVWGIGRIDGHEDYLPLAEIQPDKEPKGHAVNESTLKAIKMTAAEVQVLMDASIYGGNSLAEINKKLKWYRGITQKKQFCEAYERAIPLLKKITREEL